MENSSCNQSHTQADTLESGINVLIMGIQNSMLAEQMLKNQNDNQFLQELRQFMNEQPAS